MKYLKLFGAVSIWAVINGLVVRGVKADPTAIGFWMGAIGVCIALLHLTYLSFAKNEKPFAELNTKKFFLLAGLGVAAGANNVFFYVALKHQVANAALVHYLAQPISLIFLFLFLGEKIFKWHIGAMVFGFAGAAVIAWENGHFNFDVWFIFAFLSAIFYAGEISFSKALGIGVVSACVSALTKLGFQMGFMKIGSVTLGQSLNVHSGEFFKIVLAGVLLYLSFVWVFDALQDSPGQKAVSGSNFGIIGYVDRLGAVLLGIMFFPDEQWKLSIVIGGMLILAAQALVIFGLDKKPVSSGMR